MTRINVYRYPDDDGIDDRPQFVGHFDDDKAERFEERTRFDGSNMRSLATGDQWTHEALYRTAGGRWVLHSWSQWQGTQERFEFVGDSAAREWLLRNEYDDDEIARATGEEIPEEAGPPIMGRPEIGRPVQVRFPAETLAAVDEIAASAGVTRAAWIRWAVDATIAGGAR